MSPARGEINVETYSGRLGNRLRKQRDKLGLSAVAVVEKMERLGFPVSHQTYYGWETGRKKFNVDAAPILARVLKFKNPQELFPTK